MTDVHAYCGVQHDSGIKLLAAVGHAAKYDVSTCHWGIQLPELFLETLDYYRR